MSSYRGDFAFANLSQENTSSPKKLVNSRWAPGGFEDQRIANQTMADEQAPNDKATNPPAKGINTSRWSAGPAEQNKTNQKTAKFNKRSYKPSGKKPSNLTPNQPRRINNNDKPSPIAKTPVTSRLIGPLSEEEKSVKMENPYFDPEKHKGLSSSRWANDDEPSSATPTAATPRRIIGELSEEEKFVKMEIPFFDPKKHKGLGSSRWANE